MTRSIIRCDQAPEETTIDHFLTVLKTRLMAAKAITITDEPLMEKDKGGWLRLTGYTSTFKIETKEEGQ